MKRYKLISKVSLVLLLAVSLNLAMVPGMQAARLTSAKDTMTRTQISGTGSATAGYTLSTVAVTDGFNIVSTANNIICLDTDGTLGITTLCLDTGQIKVNLITNGGLISGVVYTGDQIATAIKTAIEAADTDADDTYTVSYDESTDKFTIRGDGGNTFNPAIGWALYAGADNAKTTLGYTLDDTAIRDADKISDSAVAFNVVSASNNTLTIQVDGTNSGTITITANPYTGATLATEIQTRINADATLTAAGKSVTVAYSPAGFTNKFKITSASTGANSTIRVTEGTTDFLKTVNLVGDVPVDGATAGTTVAANHTIDFTTTTAVAAGEKVVVDFPLGFNLPTALDYADMDMKIAAADVILAAAPSGTTWGVSVTTGDGGFITITSGTGTIGATTAVQIEIGRNATFGVTGIEQITNPTTVGLYQILVKTTTAADATIDDTYTGVYIVPDDSVVITATVDPVLSLSLYGGTYIDFGTLEPNAYHKLGGAKNATGSITLTNVSIDDVLDAETVTVRGIIYEFSDDGVIAAASNAKVDIVDNANNYLSTSQVAANLYRAINNYDGDLVRANINPATTDKVYVMVTQPGSSANAWTITETVTDVDFTVVDIAGGLDGYNQKGSAVTYGGGAPVGNAATGTNIVISTNAAGGYVLTVQNTDSNGANDAYDGLTNGIVEISQWSGNYGYGILASSQSARYGDGTSTIIESTYQGDGTGDAPGTMSTTVATLAQLTTGDVNPATTAGDNIAIEYNVRILPDQAAGLYTDTVTYILTSTF